MLNRTEQRSLRNPTAAELLALGTVPTASGVSVTPDTALTYSAVLSCIRILSETVGTLPLILYERQQPRGKRRATPDWRYGMMHDAPNPRMTRFEYMTTVMGHLAGWGNHYSERQIDGAGRTIALWPLRPDRMIIEGSAVTGLTYRYDTGGKIVPLSEDQVLHFRGMGSDGIRGYSVLRLAREDVALGMATREYGSRWFGNGARPTVVLEHPGKISKDAQDRLLNNWREKHEGLSNAHRVAVLEEGMKIETIGIPPEDSQFLQTRKFQRVEVAAMFRVPAYMIGEMEGAIKSNVEQQSMDLWQSVMAWLVCIEQRCALSLLNPKERSRYLFEFLVDSLVRADIETRYKAYVDGIQWGFLSRDEVRERENLNPMPDGIGEVYWQPLNMIALNSGDPAEASPAGKPVARSLPRQTEQRAIERRQAAASGRRRLAQTYRKSLAHTAQRVVNREVNDLNNARERFSKTAHGIFEFRTWFQRWLEEHDQVVYEYLQPALRTYGNLVVVEIERELERTIPDDIETFVQDYITSRAGVWVGKLRRGVNDAAYAEDEDPWGLLDDYLAKRKDKYADSFAMDETVRFGNALARTAYQLLTILTMMWMSTGESCGYCAALDGQVVSTSSNFLPAGNELKPEGETAFVSESNIGHPPLHGGCDCVIVAGG